MLKIIAVVLFVTVVGTTWADKVRYKDCGSVDGKIKAVDVTPCPSEPCPFARNKNVSVSVTFTANVVITNATTKVYGYILGVKVPFKVPADACQDMKCPVTNGTTTTYTNTVFVEPAYPRISLMVQWEVHDIDNMIFCFVVPVEITG